MPKIRYQQLGFNPTKLDIIRKANSIITDYSAQGYSLTLRQVYYQFVARDWFPDEWKRKTVGSKLVRDPEGTTNNQQSYKDLGRILGDARMAGLVDWESMEDRTREMGGNSHWNNPESIVNAVASQYLIDKWQGQKYRPEVWVEKDALEGVVGTVCKRLDIPYFSCRGYTSLTSIWANAQRLKQHATAGAIPVILHLGDHDPSGIDMSRDIQDRVRMFMDGLGDKLEFERLALNFPQIEEFDPPENPAKSTDSRYKKYEEEFGDSSWELDALEPAVLDRLITEAVAKYRDEKLFNRRRKLEDEHKELLGQTSSRWQDVVNFLRNDEE